MIYYTTFDPNDLSSITLSVISHVALINLKLWMRQNMLKLNDDKT